MNLNNNNSNAMSNSYDELEAVNANDIPQLVAQCLASKVNLLIYGEPGCGKSSIIEQLASDGSYNLVQLGAASLCEEMINGIPVHDSATNRIKYDMPEWLATIKANYSASPDTPQILFIDELTLAKPEVMNSLQLLLTARAVPTHPQDVLPENVVIISATNTAEDSNEGCELSRPLKTRFMTVRMTNSPESFTEFVMSKLDDGSALQAILQVLGEERAKQFVKDSVKDFSEHWCNNTKFYGVNPRTIMNFFNTCNYIASTTGNLTTEDVNTTARRTTGQRILTTNWQSAEATESATRKAKVTAKTDEFPSYEQIELMSQWEVQSLIEAILNSKKAGTKKAIKTLCLANSRLQNLQEAENN